MKGRRHFLRLGNSITRSAAVQSNVNVNKKYHIAEPPSSLDLRDVTSRRKVEINFKDATFRLYIMHVFSFKDVIKGCCSKMECKNC